VKTYYFVGGPVEGEEEAFLRRLAQVGGSPLGWQIYPHASGDGLALHLVVSDGEEAILDHLMQFAPIYERSPIVEVVPRTREP
jgi:hypothetical protein